MARVTLLVFTPEAIHLEEAIALFNEREDDLGNDPILRHKVKKIRLISKGKNQLWREESEINFYDISLQYSDSAALFLLGQDFGQRKVFAMQQGTYGKEVPVDA